tara:strand:+ start:1494 stop:1739 length:246 start_codon:yes stop_codon:yes gene_type:complete
MKYFIMLPGDTNESALFESSELGEDTGFGVFWAGLGLKVLMTIVDKQPEILPHITIKTDKGQSISVEQFLTQIKGLKVRAN